MKPGRKSTAELSVVSALPLTQRMSAPGDFTDDEKAVWDRIVESKPAEWFTEGDAPLLVEYCRNVIRLNGIDKALKRIGDVPATPDDYKLYRDLIKDSCRIAGVMKTAAVALRLTQQSRYTPGAAATASKKSNGKPWQTT